MYVCMYIYIYIYTYIYIYIYSSAPEHTGVDPCAPNLPANIVPTKTRCL